MPDLKMMIEDNRKERERLLALLSKKQGVDLGKRLLNGWTVKGTLAHLAFWDLRQLSLIKRWVMDGTKPGNVDPEGVNDALVLFSEFIPSTSVVNLVIAAAEAVDREVEKLTPAQAEELLKMGLERNIHRALHRRNHLDKIEKALKG